jgi:general secretion pathway protein H
MTLPSDIRRHDAGFTLIEIVVVMALMSLMIAMVVGRGLPASPATHLRGAVHQVSGALREARSESVMSNRSVYFNLDTVNRRFWWGNHPAITLTGDLSLALLTASDQTAGDAVGRIRFDPDGGSTGGRVAIAGGDRTLWVGVDWLSGRVSIVQKQQ